MLILKKIGKYEILSELRREPGFVEYKARDLRDERLVALRAMTPSFAASPEYVRRFYRDARISASVQHPNVLATYEFGEDHGTHYVALELLEGTDLAQVVEQEKRAGPQGVESSAVLLGYILQVCRALAYLHARGIVHRDIKPGSIFITRQGQAKLTEFSVAYPPEPSDVSSGMLLGTVGYMSPEAVKGEKVDGRSDIWGVGCTMYEVLTYTKPFDAEKITARLLAIMSQEPKSVRKLRPDLPREVDDVVRRTLRKDRDERYQNMEQLLTDLEPLVQRMQSAAGKP